MKNKSVLILLLALLLFSCNNDDVEENQKPKIYKVTYYGNGNTSGEVPVDDNLYAEGGIRFL
jgi:PBP1b-binding outer membrane lipoprotein LpoB